MKIRWIVVALVWIATFYSIFACPYDLHGSSMCSPFARAASYFGFVFAFPGLLLAATVSSVFDPWQPINHDDCAWRRRLVARCFQHHPLRGAAHRSTEQSLRPNNSSSRRRSRRGSSQALGR